MLLLEIIVTTVLWPNRCFSPLLTLFFFRLPNTLDFVRGMVNQQVCHNDGFLLNCCLISLVGGINQVEYQFLQCHRQAAMLSLTAVSYYSAPVQDQPAGTSLQSQRGCGLVPEGVHRATHSWLKGWWDGAEGGLCKGSVPGTLPKHHPQQLLTQRQLMDR